jgi:acetyl esterase/lipase
MTRSILVLPGGGYSSLAPHEGEPVAEWLRGIGWDARVIAYPVKTRHPGPLNAVRKELIAARGAGATQVGVIGFSAGGHLAGHAALALPEGERPDFAILAYPVVSMVTPTHAGSREQLLGPRPWRRARKAASLELLVTPTSPPMFVWSTGEDASVPVAQHAYRLGAALATAGVDHDLHIFENGGPHGIGLAPGTATGQAWTHLAEQWLAKR